MRSSSATLFPAPAPKKKVSWIDKIPAYEEDALVGYNENIARFHAVILYQFGANLLNTGVAYNAHALLEKYHQLPQYDAENGRHRAKNPLHALFVIKIGLDHSDAKEIVLRFLRLKFEYSNKTIRHDKIVFPNGSEMLGEFAVLQLLRAYIMNQKNRFNFMSEADRGSVDDNSNIFLNSYVHVAGQAQNNDDNWIRAAEILSAPIEKPKQKEAQAMHVLTQM